MEEIFVFGASGHAKVVVDIIERQGFYKISFLADDDLALKNAEFYGYRIIGGKVDLLKTCQVLGIKRGIVAIGNNTARAIVADWLLSSGFSLVSAIHPSAQIGRRVHIARGTVVMAGAVINSGAKIGENVVINTGANIDHDCNIGCGVHVAPGSTVCGTVKVGDGTLIGAGATIIPNIKIGSNAIVGAGSTVINDIPDGVTAIGTPAKQISDNRLTA